MKRILFLALCFCVSCSKPDKIIIPDSDLLSAQVQVATVKGQGDLVNDIAKRLREKGIKVAFEYSLMYSLWVERDSAEKARVVIREYIQGGGSGVYLVSEPSESESTAPTKARRGS